MAINEKGDTTSIIKYLENVTSICRVCTLRKECQNIFQTKYSDLTYADLYYYSTRIQLCSQDNPYYVCLMCVGKLLNTYEFIIQCEKAWYAQKQLRMRTQIEITKLNDNPENVLINNDSDGMENNTKTSQELKSITMEIKPEQDTCQTLLENILPREEEYIDDTVNIINSKEERDSLIDEEKTVVIFPGKRKINEDDLIIEVINVNETSPNKISDLQLENVEDDNLNFLEKSDNESEVFNEILDELTAAEMDLNSDCENGSPTEESQADCEKDKSKPPFKCVKCPRNFWKVMTLNRHLLMHLNKSGKQKNKKDKIKPDLTPNLASICEHCGESFKTIGALTKHQTARHLSRTRIDTVPVTTPTADINQLCNVCGKTFHGLKQLRKHLTTHDEGRRVPCMICNNLFSSTTSLKRHLHTHTGVKSFQCHYCGKRFAQGQQLREHLRIHTGDRPFLCQHCGASFTTSTNLKLHVRGRHENERSHVCEICGKGFLHKSGLANHMSTHNKNSSDSNHLQKQHTNNLSTCKLCEQVFSSQKEKLQHDCPNDNLKKFYCTCGKRFRTKQLLVVHRRIHTGERPFKCTECPQAFRSKAGLKEHTYCHTGEKRFICDICGKACTQRQQLVSHMRVHSGLKPYECKYCGTSFAMKGNLTVHMRKHTGETPYTCVCGAKYSASNALKRHMARCRGTEAVGDGATSEDEELITDWVVYDDGDFQVEYGKESLVDES